MLPSQSLRGKVKWSVAAVTAVKAAVKTDLDAVRREQGAAATLKHALAEISRRDASLDPTALLERFVYIVSAIFHHSRYGGLSASRERALAELAYGILAVAGIRPGTSTLSGLYGELHLALSHSHRQRGEHWKAAWDQQLGSMLARSAPPGGRGFPLLSSGLRALRLAHGPDALASFRAAERVGLAEQPLALARLSTVLCLRLAGELDEADAVAATTLQHVVMPEPIRVELEWEAMCRALRRTGDLAPLVAATRKGGAHYVPVYVLETYLWSLSLKTTAWTARLPSVARLPRRVGLSVAADDPYYLATSCLESCYDDAVPLARRLKALGEVVDGARMLLNIDKELLVLGAAARWLSRVGNLALATLVVSRYRSLSRDLSDGRGDDALGVLGDMLEKDWYLRRGTEVAA